MSKKGSFTFVFCFAAVLLFLGSDGFCGNGSKDTSTDFFLAGTQTRESEGNMSVRFNWEPAERAVKYQLVVSRDPDFKSIEVQKIVADNSVVLTLGPEKTYYWKVGAIREGAKVWNTGGVKAFSVPALAVSKPRVVVPRGTAVIDGKFAAAEWDQAAKFNLTNFPFGSSADVDKLPECRVMWDDAAMYIRMTIWFPKGCKVNSEARPRDSLIHMFDSLEIFLYGPGRSKGYHFILNASDSIYDDYGGDTSFNGEWKHAVGVHGAYWDLEIAISFATIGETPSAGNEWKAEFHANLKTQSCVPTWSTKAPPFGKVEEFGTLILGK